MKNLVMFKQLCGDEFLVKKKVILVTTMWDTVSSMESSDRKKHDARERELKETPEFWGKMLKLGSSYHRHCNTAESARKIVLQLVNRDPPVATSLQEELVTEQKPLNETSAGQEVLNDLLRLKMEWAGKIRELQEQLQGNDDAEIGQILQEELDEYAANIERIEGDTESIHATFQKLLADQNERFEKILHDLRMENEALKNLGGRSIWTNPTPVRTNRHYTSTSPKLDPGSDDLQVAIVMDTPIAAVFPKGMVDKMGLTVTMLGPVVFCLSPLFSIA